MQQEKLNNLLQQKLGELETLPRDVEFDSSDAWKKLETKLGAGPEGRREKLAGFRWLAAAAAAIGIITTTWILTGDKNGGSLAKTEIRQQKVVDNKTTHMGMHKDKAITVAPVKKPVKKSVVRGSIQTAIQKEIQQQNILETKTEVIQQPVLATISPEKEEPQNSNYKPQTVLASAPVKKFRIVHNNETISHQAEAVKNNTALHSGFPFFKHLIIEETNVEDIYEDAVPQARRKERTFLKTITNSIKN